MGLGDLSVKTAALHDEILKKAEELGVSISGDLDVRSRLTYPGQVSMVHGGVELSSIEFVSDEIPF